MLGNCEKNMVLIPSTTNEWTENNQIDEKGLIMASSAATTTITTRVMEKPNQDQQQQHQPLKCPRCDSSNTKFCYYNNYSLSQPRHFCKACKRYWTRGGTLRNVPVGGGCRKNKRVKRPTTSAATTEVTINSSATTCTNPSVQTGRGQIDLSPSGSAPHIIDPLFYSLLTNNINSSDLNVPSSYPRFSSSRVSNIDFDPSPQMINGHGPIGLGFASGLLQGSRDVVVSSSNNNNSHLLSSYPSIFGSTSTTSSSLQQQQLMMGSYNEAGSLNMPKDVKMEDIHQNRMGWNINVSNNQNHNIEQINSSDAASSLLWNATGLGAWLDPASNIGSSVPSLI